VDFLFRLLVNPTGLSPISGNFLLLTNATPIVASHCCEDFVFAS